MVIIPHVDVICQREIPGGHSRLRPDLPQSHFQGGKAHPEMPGQASRLPTLPEAKVGKLPQIYLFSFPEDAVISTNSDALWFVHFRLAPTTLKHTAPQGLGALNVFEGESE